MSTEENKKRIRIILSILAIILCIVFFIWNMVWFSYREENYKIYMGITKDPIVPDTYSSFKDGLSYSVNQPSYLILNGNLGISDEHQNILLVFPKYKEEPVYCIILSSYKDSIPIIIDNNGAMKDNLEYPKEIRDTIIKNQKEIDVLVCAFDEWTVAAKEGNNNYFKNNLNK